MKQTQNYQLNQWEMTDRIQMEDFNADNAKVDAALAEEKAAREAVETELSGQIGALSSKAGMQLIRSVTLHGTADVAMALPLSDIDWAAWKAVHIVLEFSNAYLQGLTLYLNASTKLSGITCSIGTATPRFHGVFYPMNNPAALLTGISVGDSPEWLNPGLMYSAVNNITILSGNSGYNYVVQGPVKATIWGEQ